MLSALLNAEPQISLIDSICSVMENIFLWILNATLTKSNDGPICEDSMQINTIFIPLLVESIDRVVFTCFKSIYVVFQ